MDCFNFFRNRKIQYIYQHKNNFQVLGLCDKDFCNKDNLDMKDINIWVCDTDLNLIAGTEQKLNKLNPHDYVNKNIYDVEPKDFGKFCGDLHKQAQHSKESIKLNLILNEKIVYIVTKPLFFLNNVIASSLFIIPYKISSRNF
jgi:hypothetical protein